MTESELFSIAAQVPFVVVTIYFIGREINALAKRVDENHQTMVRLVESNQKVVVDMTSAVTRLCTLIEKYPIKCPRDDEK